MIEFTLPLNPIACPRPRMTKSGRVYYPAAYNRWKREAARMLPGILEDAGLFHPLQGQLVVVLVFELPRPKSSKFDCPKEDIDNLMKSIFDACNGLVWDDDRQVVAVDAVKRWTPKVRGAGSISMSVEYRREQ